ncbi:MAG: virulence protein RhuM/Fic/DOC family protein [Elusimicrobiota bacterium]|nr:virulence protein RhuM/Fic/DOC family protein [Elusimicrobiota bacterium]
MKNKTGIVFYKNRVEVRLEENTLWLTQSEIAKLFDVDRSGITKHINNIFAAKELSQKSNVQFLHIANSDKPIKFFNLDVIISVGYRINSQKATQFRIWATNVLKKHLIDGYTINEKRLQEAQNKYKELQNTLALFSKNISKSENVSDEAKGILQVISGYSRALDILDKYDHQQLKIPKGGKEDFKITYEKASEIINVIRADFKSDLFGQERGDSFKSSIKDIYQTFDGEEVYKSVQEKAANLLYFIVKNHCFNDGNKRIAATIFIVYLQKNKILIDKNGVRIIDDNALAALTLMIAESDAREKDMIIKIVVNLLNV